MSEEWWAIPFQYAPKIADFSDSWEFQCTHTEQDEEEDGGGGGGGEESNFIFVVILFVCFMCCCVVSFIYDRSLKKLISSCFRGKMLIYSSGNEFCFRNTIENFVFRDVGYRFCLSDLSSQKVLLFRDTHIHVFFLVPLWSVPPYVRRFSPNSKLINSIICRYLAPNLTQIKLRIRKTRLKFINDFK
jgi:hypothetical protein